MAFKELRQHVFQQNQAENSGLAMQRLSAVLSILVVRDELQVPAVCDFVPWTIGRHPLRGCGHI